jgi:hypothetical protein
LIYKDPYEQLSVDVDGLTSIRAFAAAESFNLALLSNGTVALPGADAGRNHGLAVELCSLSSSARRRSSPGLTPSPSQMCSSVR